MRRFLLQLTAVLGMAVCHIAPVLGQEIGLDFLGIKSRAWDCNAMMAAVNTLPKPIPCGAFLDDTFGTSDACLRRLLASGKCSSFRGHLAWTNHKPLPASALAPRARSFDALIAAFPGITSYWSAICEHAMSAQTSAALNASLKPLMPHVRGFVDSGMTAADPSAIRECHGPNKKCTAVSLDGQDALDYDVEAFKRNGTLYSLLWGRSFNCKFSDKDTRPPSKRTDCPTQDQFNHYVRLLFPMPAYPSGERLQPNEIWKPSAENYGGCKGRDCKPVAILNTRSARVDVVGLNGRVLGWMRYGGTYGRNQHRYYLGQGSGQTAFQLGQGAEAQSGSEFVLLKISNRKIVVNSYRRGGLMR